MPNFFRRLTRNELRFYVIAVFVLAFPVYWKYDAIVAVVALAAYAVRRVVYSPCSECRRYTSKRRARKTIWIGNKTYVWCSPRCWKIAQKRQDTYHRNKLRARDIEEGVRVLQ